MTQEAPYRERPMGDRRFDPPLRRIQQASDRAKTLREMSDEDVISALAASARENDPYLSNVLATEAHNRIRTTRAITDAVAEGVIVASPDGRVYYINAAAERMFGLGVEEFERRRTAGELQSEHGSEQTYNITVDEHEDSRREVRIELEMRRGNGEYFWTEQSISPVTNLADDIVAWVTILRDVTEARLTRNKLHRTNEVLEALFVATHRIGIVVDKDLRILRVTPSFTAHNGLTQEEVEGKPLARVVEVPTEDVEAMRAAILSGRAFESISEVDPAGERVWNWTAEPLRDAEGDVFALQILAIDVTEREPGRRGFLPEE